MRILIIFLRKLKHAVQSSVTCLFAAVLVFAAARGLALAAASEGWCLAVLGLLTRWLLLRSTGSGHRASAAAVPLGSAVWQQGGQTRVP